MQRGGLRCGDKPQKARQPTKALSQMHESSTITSVILYPIHHKPHALYSLKPNTLQRISLRALNRVTQRLTSPEIKEKPQRPSIQRQAEPRSPRSILNPKTRKSYTSNPKSQTFGNPKQPQQNPACTSTARRGGSPGLTPRALWVWGCRVTLSGFCGFRVQVAGVSAYVVEVARCSATKLRVRALRVGVS